jgi:hypothetical protein
MSRVVEMFPGKWKEKLQENFRNELKTYNESEIVPTGFEIALGMIEKAAQLTMTGIRVFYQMTPTRSTVSKETKSEKDPFSTS